MQVMVLEGKYTTLQMFLLEKIQLFTISSILMYFWQSLKVHETHNLQWLYCNSTTLFITTIFLQFTFFSYDEDFCPKGS